MLLSHVMQLLYRVGTHPLVLAHANKLARAVALTIIREARSPSHLPAHELFRKRSHTV